MRFKWPMVFVVLACAMAPGVAGAAPPPPQNLSRGELKKLIQSAHTSEDYLTLASYFRSRQQQFDRQAHDELVFWAQRSANVSLEAAKYPRPEDSSRNRYEYFTYEATKMSQQAAYFEALSTSAGR